ncbi:hypothetical protein B566_EDAN002166 [Ephemera danica]|nr:hypothetical protein B566_EDAN002166 [Ephemera danica]
MGDVAQGTKTTSSPSPMEPFLMEECLTGGGGGTPGAEGGGGAVLGGGGAAVGGGGGGTIGGVIADLEGGGGGLTEGAFRGVGLALSGGGAGAIRMDKGGAGARAFPPPNWFRFDGSVDVRGGFWLWFTPPSCDWKCCPLYSPRSGGVVELGERGVLILCALDTLGGRSGSVGGPFIACAVCIQHGAKLGLPYPPTGGLFGRGGLLFLCPPIERPGCAVSTESEVLCKCNAKGQAYHTQRKQTSYLQCACWGGLAVGNYSSLPIARPVDLSLGMPPANKPPRPIGGPLVALGGSVPPLLLPPPCRDELFVGALFASSNAAKSLAPCRIDCRSMFLAWGSSPPSPAAAGANAGGGGGPGGGGGGGFGIFTDPYDCRLLAATTQL